MKKYLEKLKSTDLSRIFWKNSSTDLPESEHFGCLPVFRKDNCVRKKRLSLSTWLLIALPLFTFLSIGFYFIVTDVKILKSIAEKKANAEVDTSESSWSQTTDSLLQNDSTHQPLEVFEPQQPTLSPEENDSDLLVRFDYVDLSSEDIPPDGHFVDGVLAVNSSDVGTRETIIILKNDDSGKKIFLRTSATVLPSGKKETEEEHEGRIVVGETTTPKAFVYSPTIPQTAPKKPTVDVTTKGYNHSEDSGCFSTRIPFCEGVLPYDVVRLPDFPGLDSHAALAAALPYFHTILQSGCSPRARQFLCAVLEPECQPEGLSQRLPCKLNCKVFSDDCKDFILETLPLSRLFDCRRYPDWDENQNCLNMFKGQCQEEEFRCSDGSCIPLKWVCDGIHDCPGSRPSFDESNCQGCTENEFRCVLDGKCVPLHWKCDGQIDCVDRSDEMSC